MAAFLRAIGIFPKFNLLVANGLASDELGLCRSKEEWTMKILLITAGTVLLLAASASAQAATSTDAGPVEANSQAVAATDQTAAQPMNIRQQIQSQLTKNGYTNVSIMPSSFLVHATDKSGNPVEMVIGPDSFTTVTEIAPKTSSAPAAATQTPNTTTPAPKG